MELFLDLLTGLCFFLGSISIIIGACGLIKLPDVFARIHAAGMIDTGGTAFFILGMILQSGWSLITVKLILIGIFIFLQVQLQAMLGQLSKGERNNPRW